MPKIAIITHCKQCPWFDYIFKFNCRDKDDFHCQKLGKWLRGKVYEIHKDCPLEDETETEKHKASFCRQPDKDVKIYCPICEHRFTIKKEEATKWNSCCAKCDYEHVVKILDEEAHAKYLKEKNEGK